MAEKDLIGLNVGGKVFLTTRSTLTSKKSPDGGDTFFHALLSGRFNSTKDSQGNYFIDRDGDLFAYVLKYLRDGKWRISSLSEEDQECLADEAAFYMVRLQSPNTLHIPSDIDLDAHLKEVNDNADSLALARHESAWALVRESISARFARHKRERTHYPLIPISEDSNTLVRLVSGVFLKPNWRDGKRIRAVLTASPLDTEARRVKFALIAERAMRDFDALLGKDPFRDAITNQEIIDAFGDDESAKVFLDRLKTNEGIHLEIAFVYVGIKAQFYVAGFSESFSCKMTPFIVSSFNTGSSPMSPMILSEDYWGKTPRDEELDLVGFVLYQRRWST